MKLSGENLGEKNLHDIRFGNDFLDMTPKTQAIKEKNKLDSLKIKTFVHQEILSGE